MKTTRKEKNNKNNRHKFLRQRKTSLKRSPSRRLLRGGRLAAVSEPCGWAGGALYCSDKGNADSHVIHFENRKSKWISLNEQGIMMIQKMLRLTDDALPSRDVANCYQKIRASHRFLFEAAFKIQTTIFSFFSPFQKPPRRPRQTQFQNWYNIWFDWTQISRVLFLWLAGFIRRPPHAQSIAGYLPSNGKAQNVKSLWRLQNSDGSLYVFHRSTLRLNKLHFIL